MESMRDVLRKSLGRSLEAMTPLDRLRAAWPVACGKVMASHAEVVAITGGVVHITVPDSAWFDHMLTQRETLLRDLAKIAAVPVTGIHFSRPRDTLTTHERERGGTSR